MTLLWTLKCLKNDLVRKCALLKNYKESIQVNLRLSFSSSHLFFVMFSLSFCHLQRSKGKIATHLWFVISTLFLGTPLFFEGNFQWKTRSLHSTVEDNPICRMGGFSKMRKTFTPRQRDVLSCVWVLRQWHELL